MPEQSPNPERGWTSWETIKSAIDQIGPEEVDEILAEVNDVFGQTYPEEESVAPIVSPGSTLPSLERKRGMITSALLKMYNRGQSDKVRTIFKNFNFTEI